MSIVEPTPAVNYHAHPAISRSGLVCFRQSRRLYHARHVLGLPEAQVEPTPQMNLGTLCHAELLEPGSLEGKYVVLTDWPDYRTKAAREWRDAQTAAGKMVVRPGEIDQQVAVVKAACALAGKWIERATAIEQPIFWVDRETGLACRCKPDWIVQTPGTVYVLDFKTTDDASPSAFARRFNDGLWLQDEHYTAGVQAEYGDEFDVQFLFVVVETKLPYRGAVYRTGREFGADRAITAEYRDTLHAMAACYAADDWREPWEGQITPLTVWERSFKSDAMGRS